MTKYVRPLQRKRKENLDKFDYPTETQVYHITKLAIMIRVEYLRGRKVVVGTTIGAREVNFEKAILPHLSKFMRYMDIGWELTTNKKYESLELLLF